MPEGPRRVPDWHLEDERLGRMRILGRQRDRHGVRRTSRPCRGYVPLEVRIIGGVGVGGALALGMKVKRDFSRHTVSLSQKSYIENLVERFGLQGAQTVTTPLAPRSILTKD